MRAWRSSLVGSGVLAAVLAVAWAVALLGAPLAVLVRNTPGLEGWAQRLLPSPPVRLVVLPTAGDAADTGALYLPAGSASRPGVLLVNGTEVPQGWRDPDIERFARSLAELGNAVYVPDLPGLKDTRLSARALPALAADIAWLHASGYARGGRVVLLGVCVGASLALIAAAEPANRGAVASVIGLDPYASLADVLRAATTGMGPNAAGRLAPFAMAAWVQADVARAVAAPLVGSAPSRQRVLQALARSSPLDPLRGYTAPPSAALSASGRAWWRLLGNRDPARFAALLAALPAPTRQALNAFSPLGVVQQIQAPVLLVAPEVDFAFPAGDATALQQANPSRVQLIRSAALDHVTPSFSPGQLAGYWQLLHFAIQGSRLLA